MAIHCKPSGGGGPPGGINTQVQFNDNGIFGADPNLTFEKNANLLSVLGANDIINGTFETDTDWTKTGDAYIDTVNKWADFNIAFYVGQTGTWSPQVPLSITIGTTYILTFDLDPSMLNVNFSFTVGGFNSGTINAGGSYAFMFTASAGTNLTFTATVTATKKTAFYLDNVELRVLGTMQGYIDSYGIMLNSDVDFLADAVIDIGDTSNGVASIHLGQYAGGVALPTFTGIVCRRYAGGDIYFGMDNIFMGYYVQKTVASGSTATDNSTDYTNLYQGDSGYKLISMMYSIEHTGTFNNGVEIGAGATDCPPFFIGGYNAGFMFYFDNPNNIMTLDGNKNNIPILEIALNSLTVQECVRPATDNKIDLGDTANNLLWKNIYAAGVIDAATNFAIGGSNGHTGWFDDGVNFRVTVTGGIITSIQNSIAGGWL